MLQEWAWLMIMVVLLAYSNPLDGLGMSEKCGIDPREEIINFVAWILAPVALSRSVIFLAYRSPRQY